MRGSGTARRGVDEARHRDRSPVKHRGVADRRAPRLRCALTAAVLPYRSMHARVPALDLSLPLVVYTQHIALLQSSTDTVH